MPFYHLATRVEYMDQLIYSGRTGPAAEFAQKIDLSVSQLKEYLRDMRDLGAPIVYCRHRRSYCYERGGRFHLRFGT